MKDNIVKRCLEILKEATDIASKNSSIRPKTKEEMVKDIIDSVKPI